MLQRRVFLWPWQRTKTEHGIDLGGGRLVPAEDLLEGHFKRMAQPAAPGGRGAQDVSVRVGPEMNAAIRVVAPSLAPLAQVAEELAAKLTLVTPTPQFRADLQRALEAELQRRLEADHAPGAARPLWALVAGALVALGLAGVALWWLRRRK